MKRWLVPVIIVLLMVGLALSASAWLPWLLGFAGANSELIQGLQALVQLALWLGAAAAAVIGYLRGRSQPERADAPSIQIETDGAVVAGDVSTRGDFVGRDRHSAEQHLTVNVLTPSSNSEPGITNKVRWSERDTEAIRYFLEQCEESPSDEDRLLEALDRWSIVVNSPTGICFTHAGALLFGPSDRLPRGLHTDVQINDRRYNPPGMQNFFGHCVVKLIKELSERLAELSGEEREDPSRRDAHGRPVRVADYPKTAIIEALVNFVIHRDYLENDLGSVIIDDDYVQFTNPGASPYSAEELLNATAPLRPKYQRNETIIKTLSRTRLNQREGGGIIRIRESLEANGNTRPDGKLGLDIQNDVTSNRFTLKMFKRRETTNSEQNRAIYLSFLLDRHSYLSLKGMGVSDRAAIRLPLLDLYVPLKARLELPEGETWKRDLRLAGRLLAEDQQALVGRLSEPLPVLDLLQKHDGLIVLGDPGAGKTTFLKFLALRLALGEGQALGLGSRLPILAPLSAYANALTERDVRLDDFITDYLHDIAAVLPIRDMIDRALTEGAALVLLDGLDEVQDPSLRHTVVERVVDFFTFHRRKGNKFVLTSRIVGYREVRPTAEGLAECTLVDFEQDEINGFVARWTATLEKQAQGETTTAQVDAERERRELLEAIQRNPGVCGLAANPLLLTILALMKRQGVTLPERRVELYDQYVRTLLSSWNRARGLGRPPGHDLDVVQTVRILAPLALWMHQVNPGAGLVKREDLRRKLEEIYAPGAERGEIAPEAAARRFLEDVREYAGLLLERGPGEYGFIHLTFEEYLAAIAIAQLGQRDIQLIVDELNRHVGDPAWREVALLAVSYLGIIQQRDQAAGAVVEALAAPGVEKPEAVVLAGEAVLDAWPGGVPLASKLKIVDTLAPVMQSPEVQFALRRQAGLVLGRLGWRPADLDEFIEIAPGPFSYGDDKKPREMPRRYWIAKYPVTNVQYAHFVEAKGYDNQQWWSAEGWSWRTGAYDSKAPDYFKNWLAQRPAEKRDRPLWWHDVERGNPMCPVVGVSWFEAQAYCNWLTGELRRTGRLGADRIVRLPDEAEWERAARWTDGREYPWGDEFDFAKANVAEEIGKGVGSSNVASFSQGASPDGLWDCAGNVWEWTRTVEGDSRVLRGGSWYDFQGFARCAVRDWFIPVRWYVSVGFRVVVSLAEF